MLLIQYSNIFNSEILDRWKKREKKDKKMDLLISEIEKIYNVKIWPSPQKELKKLWSVNK